MNDNKASSVYFILLNWKGCDDTIDCLESMTKLSYPDYYAVVVDNDSGDDSIPRIKAWAQKKSIPVTEYTYSSAEKGINRISEQTVRDRGLRQLLLVGASYNTGFCAGNNIGMNLAKDSGADYLLVLNNDTLLDARVLEPLVETSQSHPNIGLLGPLICYAHEKSKVWWGGGEFNNWLTPRYRLQGEDRGAIHGKAPYETQWVSGCATFLPIETYKKLGGFDESFFIWCDEWDLSLRVKNAGYKLFLVPSSILYHKVGKSLGITSPRVFFYSQRNMLILRRRYLGSIRWLTFLVTYLPYKFLQAIYYSIKFRNRLFLVGFLDIVMGRPGKGSGIWKRQK